MNIAEHLGNYASTFRYADLDDRVILETKNRLLDSFGCAIGAFDAPPVKAVRRIVEQNYSAKAATVLGTTHKTTPDMATFVNGLMVRYFDFNDHYRTKEGAHPSDNIAACLAIAEMKHKSGKDLLAAIVLAYEINCRLCDSAAMYTKGWDAVNYYLVASALASGWLLGLSKDKLTQSVNISLNSHLATKQTRTGVLSNWKACASPNAARNAVFSALLARGGITGPSPVFEGERGFFRLVTGPFGLDMDTFGGRGKPFGLVDTTVKYYPAEAHTQTAISAALEARKEVNSPDDIVSIIVETQAGGYRECFSVLAGGEKWAPTTKEAADHCLPYIVGMALLEGKLDNSTYSQRNLKSKQNLDFIKKIQVMEDPALTAMYPKGIPNRVTLKLKDGRVIAKQGDYPKGHRLNPLTSEEIALKFRTLTRKCFSSRQAERITDFIWTLEQQGEVSKLMKLCTIKRG